MDADVMHDANAEELASALGEAITDLPEYEALRSAEAAVKRSDAAQERIERFEAERNRFLEARQRGDAAPDDAAELRQLRGDLYELPVMQDYHEAQQALDERLDELNTTISAALDVDFADAASGCCQD